jgi:hypothetical protein
VNFGSSRLIFLLPGLPASSFSAVGFGGLPAGIVVYLFSLLLLSAILNYAGNY